MKKVWKWIVVIPVIVGIILSVWITLKNQINSNNEKMKIENVFGNVAGKSAEVTKFYTYGSSLNIEGKITGISKDNYEGIRLIVTDGENINKEYKVDVSFEGNILSFSNSKSINNSINLEELEANNKYYVKIRVKVNNNKDYKYYLLENKSEGKDIEYYSLTKNEKNNKIDIKFDKANFNNKEYSYLGIKVEEAKLPEEIYDFVIDAGHGGTDKGNATRDANEASLMLLYAKSLKEKLEEKGYKVKLTRDDENTSSYTATNMYDEDGRIQIACRTKAKYMISLHTNDDGFNGVEVFSPCKSDLSLASKIATSICENSNFSYSNSTSFKKQDGVYVRNFRKYDIESREQSARSKGLEPYNITTDTAYLYTIREVGGIATNAYVDGRDTSYSANKYYNSNQGIECYVVSLGDIKSELDILQNEKDAITNAIASCF